MDYYEILGVNENSDASEIKKSFQKLAMKWHPDRNINNQEEAKIKFQEINEAYMNLVKNGKVNGEKYDDNFLKKFFNKINMSIPPEIVKLSEQFLTPERKTKISNTINKIRDEFSSENINNYKQFYETVKSPCPKKLEKGEDLVLNLNIKLVDIYNNIEKNLNLPVYRKCEICDGKGIIFLEKKHLCTECKGTMYKKKNVNFSIWSKEKEIVFKNQGNLENQKISGDIIFYINPKKSEYEVINDYDLLLKKNISIFEIYNGFKFNYKHLDDEWYEIKYDKPIINKKVKRIVGFGLINNLKRGDLYIKYNVIFPNLDKSQLEILNKMKLSIENIDNYNLQNIKDSEIIQITKIN